VNALAAGATSGAEGVENREKEVGRARCHVQPDLVTAPAALFAGISLLADQKAVFGSQGGLIHGSLAYAPTRGARTQPPSAIDRSAGAART
jgi:hypothetical protein